MAEAAATALPSNRVNRRLAFVRWVRRTHGWFGLWGALLGLMAGVSGIWLNHRSVMKLELPDQQQTNTQLAIARSAAGDGQRHGRLAAADAQGRSSGDQRAGRAFAACSVGRTRRPERTGRAGRRCSPSAGPSSSAGPTR